ncbi:MAG: type IV secretion system protein VirB10 [Candidatus Tokpelaia sp. JSC188]|nr:MAG: type IV secretion system protein VirB10 [Candidatus Tokpelaia sp. JSC188]
MPKQKKNDEINAETGLECVEKKHISEEYRASKLGFQKKQNLPGPSIFLLMALAIVLSVGTTFSCKAKSNLLSESKKTESQQQNTVVIPSLQKTVHVEQNLKQTRTQKSPESYDSSNKTQEDLIRKRMLHSSLNEEHGDDLNSAGKYSNDRNQPTTSLVSGDLAEKLQPIRLSASKADILQNRDLLLTEGAMIDCVLETRMITTQPGMTKCHLTRDIYSASGRVVLLDRGTIVVGSYQGGIAQGQARIFVQWSRAETPKGVIINLDSPGIGPLGEGGIDGWIDSHFWDRFGGAVMISMIGDFGAWAAKQGSTVSANSIQLSNTTEGTKQAAAEALRNSINIPPTLYKNQGERLSIFVARDLDFSNVYSLHTIFKR